MASCMRRNRTNLPDVYYEGNLEMQSFRDKASVKRWTVLSGNTLFYFNTSQDTTYMEKLDLVDYKSVTDDASRDQNLTAARFNLQLKNKTIKFTAPNMEARELWKGYIHAVVQLAVAPDLTLLPGQVHDLHKAVEKEKERRRVLPGPELREEVRSRERSHSYEGVLPACYLHVTRWEAELLLDREPYRGNLLLRPGGHGNAFTMTTREILDRPVFKHYSVTQKPDGTFVIDLQNPISCSTLEEVVSLLLGQTRGTLTPFVTEEIYENHISFVAANKENGEKSNCIVPLVNGAPVPPPKPRGATAPPVTLASHSSVVLLSPPEPSLSCESDLYLSGSEDEQEPSPVEPVAPVAPVALVEPVAPRAPVPMPRAPRALVAVPMPPAPRAPLPMPRAPRALVAVPMPPAPRAPLPMPPAPPAPWAPVAPVEPVEPVEPVPCPRLPSTASAVARWRAVHGDVVIKIKPITAPPPVPPAQTIMLPTPVKKTPPRRSVGIKQNNDHATDATTPNAAPPKAALPVPASRRRPGASTLARSRSDASHGISEELKQKLARIRMLHNLD